MDFKRGYKIKPKSIESTGEVIFTDGTNEVFANEIVCRGYGYEYDKNLGVCYAFRYSKDANKQNTHQSISIKGANNEAQSGTENSIISGTKNKTLGDVQNSLVIGSNNIIQNNINNAFVTGTFGSALNQGEFVIGAGQLDNKTFGAQQMSIVQFIGQTTNDTLTSLSIQNDGQSYIEIQNNSILGFETHIIGLCTGGDEGTAGQYMYYKLVGACKINNGFDTTFTQTISTIANGSLPLEVTPSFASVADGFITLKVTGLAGVNINWYASMHSYTNKTINTF